MTYQMRKYYIILCFILYSNSLSAQNRNDTNILVVQKYISTNFNIPIIRHEQGKIDFFIYNIFIDSSGNIQSIYSLILDSTECKKEIFRVSDSIKEKFKFVFLKNSVILIPISIVYSSCDYIKAENLKNISTYLNFLKEISKCYIPNLYITKELVLNSFID